MTRSRSRRTDRRRLLRAGGSALVAMLAFLAAGVLLAGGLARSAALEMAMAQHALSGLRARTAAEAGLAAALRAQGWSATATWEGHGALAGGASWTAQVELVGARVDPTGGATEWVFEARSIGRASAARVVLSQGFSVTGALPGTPAPTWWRQLEPAP
ncbi:hypothetical protein [Thioalkalivibrio sp. XN279]|uniref:hypothetical protein n=1 Tax=Thioalkalivibrio sp. XN279 TaxID=2714953 RepID=UPI00140BD06E|nr:hypothetical protein [Thioalkalivibrio sp. XN279]NHA14902.1 hypothetical protein [Thioalkalivibrio sp. XN279]